MRGLLYSLLGTIKINQSQFLGLIRTILTFVGGIAVGKGWLSADLVTAIIGGSATIGTAIWSMLAHTKISQIMEVEKMDEVKKIVLSSEKLNGGKLSDLADSPTQEKIVKE